MFKDMKSYAHLKPGQKGTRRLVERYGAALLCVRYRYDDKREVRLKTVEIIVEEKLWRVHYDAIRGNSGLVERIVREWETLTGRW